MCVVDKIIASLVLFFFEEKDTSFLCENCLFFLKVHRQMKEFFGCFGCSLFRCFFFELFTLILYIHISDM